MSAPARQKKLDDALAKATEALTRSAWFEAERLADKALMAARQENDFERMTRVIDTLLEARLQRMQLALNVGTLAIVESPIDDQMRITPGCYLVQPPQVGSEARRLRLAALAQEVPALVLCREPLTRSQEVPIVALSPGATLRVKVPPPEDAEQPDLIWFSAALGELGDWAIDSLDATLAPSRRVDALLDALDAAPEHENLHHALKLACQRASESQAAETSAASAKAAARSKIKT